MPVINGVEVDDTYKIDLDEEDEDNYFGNDGYDDKQKQGVSEEIANGPITFSDVIEVIETFTSYCKLTDMDLKHKLIYLSLEDRLLNAKEDVLLNFRLQDSVYKAFLVRIYPEVVKVPDRNISDSGVEELIGVLIKSTLIMIWSEIEKRVQDESIDPKKLRTTIDDKYIFYPKSEDEGLTPFLNEITRDWSEVGQNRRLALDSALSVLLNLNDAKWEKKELMEEEEIKDKLQYLSQLEKKGFKTIGNNSEIAGRSAIHDTLLGIIKQCYRETPILGFKDKVYMLNQPFLEEKGLNPKNVSIWDPNIYTLDEDLMFRTLVREDSVSFTILIKLPSGVSVFDFSNRTDQIILSIPMLFSNTNLAKGQIFSSSLMKAPRVCNLGKTRKVNCAYDCIEIVLSKDLIAFKNSNWSLRNYIRACHGEQNEFSSFDDLSLGEKIVVGVMPGELKAERFDCSGKYNVSGIVGGGAGSGKTAMYDNLLVQSVALSGVEGDGAVILIDPKQEWIPIWKNALNRLNVPFYGFDGTVLNSSEIKWVTEKRGNKVVEEVPFKVSAYIGGILFIRVIYETIQVILKATGCSDILEFNSKNLNYKGIAKLPRTLILVDELNTLYSNLASNALTKEIYKGLIIARLTRTSGFLFMLGGQDPSKTLIQSDERSNYGYNIFGKMDADRYEYFNVVQNKAVIDYEEKNRTSDNPNPILSQGIFYAGKQGNTDLVKCLFVPKEERLEALKDLQIRFDGMFELDKLAKLALKEGYFETLENTLKVPNNIIYATLKHLGVLSQQEFNYYSDRVLGSSNSNSKENLDEILEVKSNNPSFNSYSSPDSDPKAKEINKVNQDYASKLGFEPKSADNFSKNSYYENENSKEAFTGRVEMPTNPFTAYGTSTNPIPTLNVIRTTSKALLTEIKRYFGDLSRVESINIKDSGLLIINNRPFRPQFSSEVIDSMPEDIRSAVSQGFVVEIFDFGTLYKFKNLQVLEVANSLLAEGRMRREMGISRRKRWIYLFTKFKELRQLIIGKEVITDEETAEGYHRRGRGGYTDEAFSKVPTYMSKMWNTRPAKIVMNGLGYSLGIKALGTIALIGGPFGILFAAMVATAAYNEYKKTHPSKLSQRNTSVQKQQNFYGQNYGNSYQQRPRTQNDGRNRNNQNRW